MVKEPHIHFLKDVVLPGVLLLIVAFVFKKPAHALSFLVGYVLFCATFIPALKLMGRDNLENVKLLAAFCVVLGVVACWFTLAFIEK